MEVTHLMQSRPYFLQEKTDIQRGFVQNGTQCWQVHGLGFKARLSHFHVRPDRLTVAGRHSHGNKQRWGNHYLHVFTIIGYLWKQTVSTKIPEQEVARPGELRPALFFLEGMY